MSSTSASDQTSSSGTGNSINEVLESIFSYNGNVMLAAIISLLLVILFVLLLHLYAKWFLAQARRRRRRSSFSVTHVLGPTRLHHFHTLSLDSAGDSPAGKGLDASVIASIPLFVHGSGERDELRQECVICLSGYEVGDVGRHLTKCGHAFHVECIDMWLQSHSSCPICRSPVVPPPCQDIVKPVADNLNHPQVRDDVADDVTVSSDGSVEILIDNVGDQGRSVDEARPDGESDGSAATTTTTTTPLCSCSCSCLTQLPSPATTLKRMMSCKIKSERKVHP